MSANPGAGQRSDSPDQPVVSVIIPARNEEDSIGACLRSIASQSGIQFEVIVVNDQSTDRTRRIAEEFNGVRVIDVNILPLGWIGKNHACHVGSQAAKGKWLLFTDADTIHRRSSLKYAIREADHYAVDMLSYSPKQEVHGFLERALMPVVFAELRRQYPPKLVSVPSSPVAAANGQYLLITRETYDLIGGHAAVKDKLLEDVELARLVKNHGRRIRFRYGRDAVSTRMYRNFAAMCEGWTKNLALLFPSPFRLALWRSLEMLLVAGGLGGLVVAVHHHYLWRAAGMLLLIALLGFSFFRRVRKAHFGWINTIIAPAGLPIFVILLVRSRLHYLRKKVSWKGRTYDPTPSGSPNGNVSDAPLSLTSTT